MSTEALIWRDTVYLAASAWLVGRAGDDTMKNRVEALQSLARAMPVGESSRNMTITLDDWELIRKYAP